MNAGSSDRFRRFQTAALVSTGLALLLVVGLPSLTLLYDLSGRRLPPQLARFLSGLAPIYAWLLQIFLAVWIVFFGGCIASFLNVVAWRLPRGKSILGRSHCPQCHTQLTLQENLPLYGWLASGGQCRYCQQPIPPRYFWVELAFGLILLLVGLVEIGTGGGSLPLSLSVVEEREKNAFLAVAPDLLWTFANHVCLLSVLYAYTLVRLESRRIPPGIFLVAIFAALAILIANPAVARTQWLGLAWLTGQTTAECATTVWSLALSLAGIPLGGILGWLTSQLLGKSRNPVAQRWLTREAAMALGTVSLFLGPISSLAVAVLTLLLLNLQYFWRRRLPSYSLAAMLATIGYLCTWRMLF